MNIKIHNVVSIEEVFGVRSARGKEILEKIDECYTELPQLFSIYDFLQKVYDQIEFATAQEIALASFYTGRIVSEIIRKSDSE